ncbi:hypothetical protein M3Y99_00790800 [Aphelenchoides fujianensis]|nr:hypothetical protein M3Y99_00790800 [Aphelenchoides fujianensis]
MRGHNLTRTAAGCLWPLEVLFGISIVSLLLSLTGRSFGIREAFANLLLLVFEWASEWQFEEEDEEPSDAAEPPTAVPPEATETVKLAKGRSESAALQAINP